MVFDFFFIGGGAALLGIFRAAKKLDERINKLHALLDRGTIVGDSAWRFTNATIVTKLKPVIPVAASFRP